MKESDQYTLQIDGKLFRDQRKLLITIADLARHQQPYKPSPGDEELLEGLLNLTDAIADQAHDRHGIDCLLDDTCQRYPSDQAVLEKLRKLDLAPPSRKKRLGR
jgi:hypothetical protein